MLTYFGPNGVRVVNPPADLLDRRIFRERGGYWKVGSGDFSLSVATPKGPKSFTLVAGDPSLS
jgi:hypothetical protein